MSLRTLTNFKTEAYIATWQAWLGTLTTAGRLKLACAALAVPKDYVNLRNAALRFIEDVGAYPQTAAETLDRFIIEWEAFEAQPGSEQPAEQGHDWQTRRDCGHG